MSFQKVDIKRIIGPTPNGAAILLGNEEKTFVIFIGFYEAAALIRELSDAMMETSICGLGQAAPNPILSVIRHFPDEAASRIEGRS